jgi:hypothetical protein
MSLGVTVWGLGVLAGGLGGQFGWAPSLLRAAEALVLMLVRSVIGLRRVKRLRAVR